MSLSGRCRSYCSVAMREDWLLKDWLDIAHPSVVSSARGPGGIGSRKDLFAYMLHEYLQSGRRFR